MNLSIVQTLSLDIAWVEARCVKKSKGPPDSIKICSYKTAWTLIESDGQYLF